MADHIYLRVVGIVPDRAQEEKAVAPEARGQASSHSARRRGNESAD